MKESKRKKLKLKIDTKFKFYNLDQSPLFKLHSKKKLGELLNVSSTDLIKIISIKEQLYNIFNDQGRDIHSPLKILYKIHNRIASLICRIHLPDYLHSGVKNRTYISNAEVHANGKALVTSDIKKFFQSTKQQMVFSFFRREMKCSTDVSQMLSELSCINGHLPTGSQLSMPMAFWSNKCMFDEFKGLSDKHEILMSVYVDDITFSGSNSNKLFLSTLKKIAIRHGHTLHPKKSKIYKKDDVKIVTGVAVKNEAILITNKNHLKLKSDFDTFQLISHYSGAKSTDCYQRLSGRLNALGQIDSKMKERYITLKSKALI